MGMSDPCVRAIISDPFTNMPPLYYETLCNCQNRIRDARTDPYPHSTPERSSYLVVDDANLIQDRIRESRTRKHQNLILYSDSNLERTALVNRNFLSSDLTNSGAD